MSRFSGGDSITIKDIITGETKEFSYNSGMSIKDVKSGIQAITSAGAKIILYLGQTVVHQEDENISLYSKYPEAYNKCSTMGYIDVTYRSVVFCQEASGLWTDGLLNLLKGLMSVKDLVDKQTDEEIKKIKPEIVLTLAGMKMLKTSFKENMKEWRFVYAKAAQQVKAVLGSGASIDALLDKLTFEVAF